MSMVIDHDAVEALARLESPEGIVSLYLRVEPRLMYEPSLASKKLKSLFKRYERRESRAAWKKAAERERPRIETFFTDWTPSPGIAIFACEPMSLWEAVPLQAPVPTWLSVDATTQTRPLALLLDEFPRLAVCVVQSDKAVLYLSEQLETAQVESLASEVPGRHSSGGWSQRRFERHREFHVESHLKDVARALEKLHEERAFERLILGGTVDVTRETERHLSTKLRSRLVGTVPVDVKHESEDEILAKARALSDEAERRQEAERVEALSERAGAGGRGVVGLEPTLQALREGRIDTLMLNEDFTQSGWECLRCDYLGASESERCPLCDGETRPTPNLVELAVERAFLAGGRVDFVFDAAARDRLAERGEIGALLRF